MKALRTSGHFEPIGDLAPSFRSVDLDVPAYANAPKRLGMGNFVPIPLLAIVSLVNGLPGQVG